MRKITANYIFPVCSDPLRNGIIVLNDENRIIDIIDTKNNFKEIANLEYYSGVIIPGFVDAFSLLSYSNFTANEFTECIQGNFNENVHSLLADKTADLGSVQRGINHLEAFGSKAAADIFPHIESRAAKERSKIHFADFDRELNYQLPDENVAANAFLLVNRFTTEASNIQLEVTHNYCIGTGSLGTHQKLSVFDELKYIQQKFPQLSVWELIKWGSLNSAKFLQIDNEFGSLEIGKKPGLNIISGIDFTSEKLTSQSLLQVLI